MLEYLEATEVIDCDKPEIKELAREIVGGRTDAREAAKRLFYFVRDTIRYNPYSPFFLPEHYKATTTLRRGKGYCVQKAVLLVALARAVGIPARLGFADIRNWRASEQLVRMMGTNLFVFHGYVEWSLDKRWIRVTPSFERDLCEENDYPIIEFDGKNDALFPHYDRKGRKFVEYVRYHGTFADLPLDLILEAWEKAYGRENVEKWKKEFRE